MNIQSIMKMQKDMMKDKEIIDKTIFENKKDFVNVKINGNKEIKEIKIDKDTLEKEDLEILEDLLLVAINETLKNIDKEAENKMSKYTKGLPGIF